MRNYKRAATILLLALSAACLVSGCKKKHREKVDLPGVETSETTPETMAEETTQKKPEDRETSSAATQPSGNSTTKKISSQIHTYTSGKVSIQYPSIDNLDDEKQSASIDELLKSNALSILDAWNIDDTKDALDIKCQVLSADRNRITAIYTGTATAQDAAQPIRIFYSNTVNVRKASNMSFRDFADPYTMAGYVLSGDCEFYNATPELMEAKNGYTIEQYTTLFDHADFPIKGDADAKTSLSAAFGFPGSFSYEDEGTIFFSIPVAHALGDYAIVAYTPETK